METVVAEVANASVMALRTNMSLLPDPKRRKIIPMPRNPEEGMDGLNVWTVFKMATVGWRGLASPTFSSVSRVVRIYTYFGLGMHARH